MHALYTRTAPTLRRHRSDAERIAILQEYETTPLSLPAFLAKHGIATAKSLYDWRNKFFPPQIVLTAAPTPPTPPAQTLDQFRASDRVLELLDMLDQRNPIVQELQSIIDVALDF